MGQVKGMRQAIILKLIRQAGNIPGGEGDLPCQSKAYHRDPMSLRGIAEAIFPPLEGDLPEGQIQFDASRQKRRYKINLF